MTTRGHAGVVLLLIGCCCHILTSIKGISTEQCSLSNEAFQEFVGIISDMSRDHNRLLEEANRVTNELRQQKKQFEDSLQQLNNCRSEQSHVLNVRHYHVAVSEDDRDFGTVQTALFHKLRSDTSLRVTWHSTTNIKDRRSSSPRSCGRYYVTFNGRQCDTPGNIDFTDSGLNFNHHQATELDGMCYSQPAGSINVSIVTGACPGFSSSDFYTGWKTSRTMWIYEITTTDNPDSNEVSAFSLMNTLYYTLSGTSNTDNQNNSIMSVVYHKRSNDTALRIKWMGTVRVFPGSNVQDGRCARWYITVDGTECQPKAQFVIGMLGYSYLNAMDHHKTRTLEGLCLGILAGTHNISLRTGTCLGFENDHVPVTLTGCCQSNSRMIVNEASMETAQTVTTLNGHERWFPFFNLRHWSWENINYGLDAAEISTVNYKKVSGSSGLHVRAVGDARANGENSCCRWYFTINGNECTRPGVIEGLVFFQTYLNYHSPIVVDGVCYGIGSGDVKIAYNVAPCNGFSGDCFTGYLSTVHLFIEESQPGQQVSCSKPLEC